MRENIIFTGMVLSSMPMGEYDRRIVLLTNERGKISAFVKGALRQKSSMKAASNIFCYGRYEAFTSGSSYTITGAKALDYFREMSSDYTLTCYGSYFLETASCFTNENEDASAQLELLYRSLKALLSPSFDNRLVRRVYELKTLTIYGVSPNVYSCALCDCKEGLNIFSLSHRGMLCEKCVRKADDVSGRGMNTAFDTPVTFGRYHLSDAAVYTLRFIISSPLDKLYSFRVSEEVLTSISHVISDYFGIYTDRKIKSARFLDDLI